MWMYAGRVFVLNILCIVSMRPAYMQCAVCCCRHKCGYWSSGGSLRLPRENGAGSLRTWLTNSLSRSPRAGMCILPRGTAAKQRPRVGQQPLDTAVESLSAWALERCPGCGFCRGMKARLLRLPWVDCEQEYRASECLLRRALQRFAIGEPEEGKRSSRVVLKEKFQGKAYSLLCDFIGPVPNISKISKRFCTAKAVANGRLNGAPCIVAIVIHSYLRLALDCWVESRRGMPLGEAKAKKTAWLLSFHRTAQQRLKIPVAAWKSAAQSETASAQSLPKYGKMNWRPDHRAAASSGYWRWSWLAALPHGIWD